MAKKMDRFSLSTFQRLPIYLNYLSTFDLTTQKNISATKIAKALCLGEVQVRKDLATLNCLGRPKTGYDIATLIKALKHTLGCNTLTDAVLVGVGKLGQALMGYGGFSEFGLSIVAGFDTDQNKVGKVIQNKSVFHLSSLREFVEQHKVKIVILTVPAEYAQEIIEMIDGSCVKGIWNFSTAHIIPPKGVRIKTENIATSLALLAKQINEMPL